MSISPKITPFLWFDTQAEDATNFYVSVFKNSEIQSVNRYPEGGPAPAGSVMTTSFVLDGQRFTALNAGPHFTFTEAISFVIDCGEQDEVDYYWDALIADGGEPSACGWLKDKYGLSWQVVPRALIELTTDVDPATAGRVMAAMMQMQKLDVAALRAAASAG